MKLLIIALFCALPTFGQETQQAKQPVTLSSPNGRYVFGQISDFRRDQYMLDTQTGRLWRITEVTLGAPPNQITFPALEEVSYITIEGKYVGLPPPPMK